MKKEELMKKMQKDFSKNLSGRKKAEENENDLTPQLNLF